MALYDKVFSSEDYLQVSDLNDIEKYLENYTTSLNELLPELNIPIHNAHTWNLNDFVYVDYIEEIEITIDNLGYYLIRPDGWIKRRKSWNFESNLTCYNDFDYRDINRWYKNIKLIIHSEWINLFMWNINNKDYEWNGIATQESWEE